MIRARVCRTSGEPRQGNAHGNAHLASPTRVAVRQRSRSGVLAGLVGGVVDRLACATYAALMSGEGGGTNDTRISEHKENIPNLLKQFDEVTVSAAATACDSRIVSQLESIRDTARRFDETMLAAAASAVPEGPGLDTLLAAVLRIPAYLNIALPELVTDYAIANILDALERIDSELNDYIFDSDTAHLANALDTGLQNLILAIRDTIGRWQLGKGPWKIQRLGLRLGVADIAGRPVAYPVLKILVDGSEKLAGRGHQYTGWHPADILGPDSPLLPTEPARRVALYVDAAGGAAAGCLAAYVKAFGDQVAWADFRRFEGVYHAPAIQSNPDGGDWRIGPAPLVFDAAQYRAEVQRASTERAWEAEPWQTALLLDQYLSADPGALGGTWNLGWAEPHGEATGMFSVTLWDDHYDHGLIVDLAADSDTPEKRARQMADFLMTTPQDRWPRTRSKPTGDGKPA